MALFILIFLILNNCSLFLFGLEEHKNKVLEIKSTTITADQSVGFYKVDETLNLTCTFKNESTSPDVLLEWVVSSKASNSQNRVINSRGTNIIVLTIKNLQENDSGEYKCKAVHNGTPHFGSHILTESSVRIKVKSKKKECTDVMFQCSPGICIPKRYTCDGHRDCPHGEDESPGHCGSGNPCDNKLMCPDYRCIPLTWCCESHKEPNCTTKVKHSCCNHVEKPIRDVDNELGLQFEQQRFSDMGFLQTTVYTVIGCAMAFMFIVTIIVIAICRVHVRRSLLSRCPAASRNLALGRGEGVSGNNFGGWSIYDLDLYFNRSGLGGSDLMSVNPLLVTYNINNGVQFVGRPIDPPPYCEVVTSPPKEGPPPPYVSQENLCARRRDKSPETPAAEIDATESDALLGEATRSISVISCNAIDVIPVSERPSSANDANSRETGNGCGEGDLKDCSDVEFSNESSQCVANMNRCNGTKDRSANVILLSDENSETAETLKIQTGESSSFAPGDVSEMSKDAVKKLYSTRSLDNNFRRKGKEFSTNRSNKF